MFCCIFNLSLKGVSTSFPSSSSSLQQEKKDYHLFSSLLQLKMELFEANKATRATADEEKAIKVEFIHLTTNSIKIMTTKAFMQKS